MSESHTCHQYGLLDKGKSSISPIESGGSHTTRGHHLWLLGQGKVARFSGGRRWLVCHQQSPLPITQLQCVKSNMLMPVGHSFGVFQPSVIMLVELTWKTSKKHTQSSVRILLFRSRICGCMLFTEKHKLVARKFDVGSSSYFHRAFEHKRRGRYSLEILCWRDSHSRQRSITARSLLAELLCWRVNHSRQRSMAP